MSDPIDEYIASKLGGAANKPVTERFPDGSLRQYDAQTNTWTVLEAAPTTSEPRPAAFTLNGDRYEYKRGRDGEWAPYVVAKGEDANPAAQWQTGSTSSPFLIRQGANGQIEQAPNPNYVPPREPQAPLGRQLTPAELQLQELQVQKAQRDLANPFVLAQQQMAEAIGAIQRQIASGEIDPAEGERLIGLSRANIGAALAGTSPWQMEQAKTQQKQFDQTFQQQKAQQQQGLARGLLGDQLSTGSNMAQGLLSGLGGIYGKILGSSAPPTNFNPLDMAKAFTYDMGGGQQMNDLAKNILMGALQGQGGL
jgi:hypothetical protein